MDYEDLAMENALFPWLDSEEMADPYLEPMPSDPFACDACGQREHTDDCPEWEGGDE